MSLARVSPRFNDPVLLWWRQEQLLLGQSNANLISVESTLISKMVGGMRGEDTIRTERRIILNRATIPVQIVAPKPA